MGDVGSTFLGAIFFMEIIKLMIIGLPFIIIFFVSNLS